MKITKNKVNILYRVLLRHFDVDNFCIYKPFLSSNACIEVIKNNYKRSLTEFSGIDHINFSWATKYFSNKIFNDYTSTDIEKISKDIPNLKYEFVKCIFQALKKYTYIEVHRPFNSTSCDNSYFVGKITNLEQLIIEEELRM